MLELESVFTIVDFLTQLLLSCLLSKLIVLAIPSVDIVFLITCFSFFLFFQLREGIANIIQKQCLVFFCFFYNDKQSGET